MGDSFGVGDEVALSEGMGVVGSKVVVVGLEVGSGGIVVEMVISLSVVV